jgi:hypothetical protein
VRDSGGLLRVACVRNGSGQSPTTQNRCHEKDQFHGERDEVDRPRDLADAVYVAMDDVEPVRVIVGASDIGRVTASAGPLGRGRPLDTGRCLGLRSRWTAGLRWVQPNHSRSFDHLPPSRAGSHSHRDGLLLTHEHDQPPAASQARVEEVPPQHGVVLGRGSAWVRVTHRWTRVI